MNARTAAFPDLRRLDFKRGPGTMRINGVMARAYKWCEMFGHQPSSDETFCERCGGQRV